jgi:aminopeptidase-like protein
LLSNWRNRQGARILRIRWPPEISILSERDQNYPDFVSSVMLAQATDLKTMRSSLVASDIGQAMYALISELYPICRSITGDGIRRTLGRLSREIPLELHEVPSGTQVFDWTVPKEWNIRDAWVKNSAGERVIDFNRHNLHVVNYSIPVYRMIRLSELRPHLHTLPEHPDWIPYRTSYYKEDWGFCLPHRQLQAMPEDEYEICIDSTLENGSLTYGESYVPGETQEEVLISCHACHPSLCNDNLSGVSVVTFLAKCLADAQPRYSYRFLFIPGTIGSITWLSRNQDRVGNIRHGLVITCVGDCGRITYKKSRRGNAAVDRAMMYVLKHSGQAYEIQEFSPYGYDERQYCSPGLDLPVGCLMRTPHGNYPEYHSSADNLELMDSASLASTLLTCLSLVYLLENNKLYLNQNPNCEPQLGRRGLYRAIGGTRDEKLEEMAMLWVLNQSDGKHTLLDIAERSGLQFETVKEAADLLVNHNLLVEGRKSRQ